MTVANRYVSFGEMTWPRPDTDLGWRLRYTPESLTRSDQLVLASIVDAYQELVTGKTVARRNACIAGIRKAMSLTPSDIGGSPDA